MWHTTSLSSGRWLSICSYACAVGQSSLASGQSQETQLLQRRGVLSACILGDVNYEEACSTLGVITLADRREQLIKQFLNSSHRPIVVLHISNTTETRSFHSLAPYSSIWTPKNTNSSLSDIIFTVLLVHFYLSSYACRPTLRLLLAPILCYNPAIVCSTQ